MFLNVNNSNRKPKMMDQVNGTAILCLGHFGVRYDKRIKRMCEELNIRNLRYKKILLKTIDAIKDNYKDVITKNDEPVRTLVRDTIKINCLHQDFDVEINVLVKSSIVDFSNKYPQVIVDGYEELLEKGYIKLYEPVICIETVIATIKTVNDDSRYGLENMDDMKVIGSLNLPPRVYKVSLDDFEYMCDELIYEENAGMTDEAYLIFDQLIKTFA